MNTMQKALRINAIFSGVSGILLVLFADQFASIFELKQVRPFWIIGLLLIFFTGTIVLEIYKQRQIAIKWIIIQDFLWVIGSVILLIWNPFHISLIGNIIIAIVALIVLGMGINQQKEISLFP